MNGEEQVRAALDAITGLNLREVRETHLEALRRARWQWYQERGWFLQRADRDGGAL